ncbi:hypothetical protein MRB53_037813 [Persea americana]|nr:hypothetical protein MRB53_037813 [Persea americana]
MAPLIMPEPDERFKVVEMLASVLWSCFATLDSTKLPASLAVAQRNLVCPTSFYQFEETSKGLTLSKKPGIIVLRGHVS